MGEYENLRKRLLVHDPSDFNVLHMAVNSGWFHNHPYRL